MCRLVGKPNLLSLVIQGNIVMFEKLFCAIEEDEELDERLKTSIPQHLQSLETVFEPGV